MNYCYTKKCIMNIYRVLTKKLEIKESIVYWIIVYETQIQAEVIYSLIEIRRMVILEEKDRVSD